MSKVVKITLTDEDYKYAKDLAAKQGRNTNSNPGVASVMRGALRYVLSKNKYYSEKHK